VASLFLWQKIGNGTGNPAAILEAEEGKNLWLEDVGVRTSRRTTSSREAHLHAVVFSA